MTGAGIYDVEGPKGGAVSAQEGLTPARKHVTMGKFFASQPPPFKGLGRHRTGEASAVPDRRFSKLITVAWLALGIARSEERRVGKECRL